MRAQCLSKRPWCNLPKSTPLKVGSALSIKQASVRRGILRTERRLHKVRLALRSGLDLQPCEWLALIATCGVGGAGVSVVGMCASCV
eukprot:4044846-Amphidinium_carterae.2